ncbi:MAG: hypothetical protein KKF44_02835 [Nanoarchaeota archaeon]|nr:hypothetical protein [Nanoarchaeota archaeon]
MKRTLCLIFVLVFIISACGQQPTEEPEPTPMSPTPTPADSPVPPPTDIPFDYAAWLEENTECPEVIHYVLCGRQDCISGQSQFDKDSGGYLTYRYDDQSTTTYPVGNPEASSFSCAQFIQSAFEYAIPDKTFKGQKYDYLPNYPDGDGYSWEDGGGIKYPGICNDRMYDQTEPEKVRFMSRAIIDLHIEGKEGELEKPRPEAAREVNFDLFSPGDVFSMDVKQAIDDKGVFLKNKRGHAAMYIGRGSVRKSSEYDAHLDKKLIELRYNANRRDFLIRTCNDIFVPDDSGEPVFIHAIEPEVCFSNYNELFGSEAIYDLKITCRPKYCDSKFNLIGNCCKYESTPPDKSEFIKDEREQIPVSIPFIRENSECPIECPDNFQQTHIYRATFKQTPDSTYNNPMYEADQIFKEKEIDCFEFCIENEVKSSIYYYPGYYCENLLCSKVLSAQIVIV